MQFRQGFLCPISTPRLRLAPGGGGSFLPDGHCCLPEGRWGALAKPVAGVGPPVPCCLALLFGGQPCMGLCRAWAGCFSHWWRRLTPSELAGPWGVSAEACRLLAQASDSFPTASPARGQWRPCPQTTGLAAAGEWEDGAQGNPGCPSSCPYHPINQAAPCSLLPGLELASTRLPFPHVGLAALGLCLVLLPPTWPTLPGSVSHFLLPPGTLSDLRDPLILFPLPWCLPDCLN